MTPAQSVAWALADRLEGLDPAAMARHRAFEDAIGAALTVADERSIVDQVVAQGPLIGARNPHAVVVARLRQLPSLAVERQQVADERAAKKALDGPRELTLRAAADRGALLLVQVCRGVMTREESLAALAWEYRGDASLLEVALDSFEAASVAYPVKPDLGNSELAGVLR